MNKTKYLPKKYRTKLYIGIIFTITLIWWLATLIRVLIVEYMPDEELKKYWDTTDVTESITIDEKLSFTGNVQIRTTFNSKESKLNIEAAYLPQKVYTSIECDVEAVSKLVENWIYLFKGGSWKYLPKEYILTCHQQDIATTIEKKISERHYKKYGQIESLHSMLTTHEPGDYIDCDNVIANSYVVHEDYSCAIDSPGYNPDKGCIKNECIRKGNEFIEKTYEENGTLIKEEGPLYTKRFNEYGELIFESKGNYDSLKMYGYSHGRLVRENYMKNGKYQEMKKFNPNTGDITHELYLKDGKPTHGYKYEGDIKIPMTNAHLQQHFGKLLGENLMFEE